MTEISVVIPFFQDEKYFLYALNSVLAQSYPPTEIVVVVDGESASARDFFAEIDSPKLRVLYLPHNQGSAAARNLGIQNAQSEYIAFLDADDVWESTKLEMQVAFMSSETECIACHTGVRVFDDQDSTLAVYVDKPSRIEMKHLLSGNQVLTSSLLIRRAAILAIGGFDTSLRTSQDFELILRLTKTKADIGFVPVALTGLRRSNHGNISSNGKLLLRNHMVIAKMYRADFVRLGGISGYLGFIAKFFIEDGSRMEGISGRLIYWSGRLLRVILLKGRL